jgi:hypothetical protein
MALQRYTDSTGRKRCRLTACPFCGKEFEVDHGTTKVDHFTYECKEAPREINKERLGELKWLNGSVGDTQREKSGKGEMGCA